MTKRIAFPKTRLEFQKWFPDEKACLDYLRQSRWSDGFVCPQCGSTRDPYSIEAYQRFECSGCGHQTSVTAGTVMHRTKMPLQAWFEGAYLVTTLTPGLSAVQFQRQLGINTYETAFQMLHKLRAAMVRPERDRIHGLVEADETLIGGKKAGKRGRGAAGKVLVVGAIEVLGKNEKRERAGRLRLHVVPDASARSLVGFITDKVEPGSIITTDDWLGYTGLEDKGYRHEVVGPKELEHIHHTFGNLKTWLKGTHHGVSSKHLQAYLNEFVFRHNRRRTPMAAFQTILGLATHAEGPTYKQIYSAGNKGGWVHPSP